MIVVVTHGGREGHPIVLPCSLRREIEAVHDGGLDRVRDAHSELVRRISTNAAGAVLDIDTPDDLRLGGV